MSGIALKSCQIKISCKAGTLASGSDSLKTITLKGANQSADAETVLEVSDAIGSVISLPILETTRVDTMLVSDEL